MRRLLTNESGVVFHCTEPLNKGILSVFSDLSTLSVITQFFKFLQFVIISSNTFIVRIASRVSKNKNNDKNFAEKTPGYTQNYCHWT